MIWRLSGQTSNCQYDYNWFMCDPEPKTELSSKAGADVDDTLSTANDKRLQGQGDSNSAWLPQAAVSVSDQSSAPVSTSATAEQWRASNNAQRAESRVHRASPRRWSISLREYLGLMTLLSLAMGLAFLVHRLRGLEAEVTKLRAETGYLQQTAPGQIAAARAPVDQPLTYRVRVRVPTGSDKFRVAYSSIWPKQAAGPQWFGAVPLPVGESVVTIRILEDPRDKKWKIASLVASTEGNQRMATVLPPAHVEVFRGSHDVLSTGVGRETQSVERTESIRLLDERWLVGEGGLLLYGDRPPESDQIGIYAELQPDVGPL